MFAPIPWEQTTATVLAQQPSVPSTDKDPGGQQEDFGKSSPLGLLILVLFFIAVFFLVRSMNKHLKKVPASFDQPDAAPEATEAKPEAKANGNGKND
nr:hypothetical protein [Saccharothrix deserti]